MTSPHPDTKLPEATGDTLRLKCPTCGGGLNLKRKHLGITGQCVHCQTPLTALEKNGTIQVVTGLDPHFTPGFPEATPPPVEVETSPALSYGSFITDTGTVSAPHHAPGLETPGLETPGLETPGLETPSLETPAATAPASAWGFPDRNNVPAFGIPANPTPEPTPVQEEIPQSFLSSLESSPPPAPESAPPSPFLDTPTPSFAPISASNTNLFGTATAPAESPFATPPTVAAPVTTPAAAPEENPFPPISSGFSLSNPSESNLLSDRNGIPDASLPPAPSFRTSALFGDQAGAPRESFSSMFKNADDSSEINPAWGTKVPQESHASISPFATGSASGGGYAESLFREKVVKESEKADSPLFVKKEDSSPIAPAAKEEFQKKVVLDGDGRPMKPMTPEEEANFAKHLFAVEKTHKRPRWVKALIKTVVTLAVLGAISTGVYFITPQEKLAEWKEKAYIWLEPGLAILDYLPEGMRPDWLPRTDLGIDAGVDENGVPKKKMNAFEGLDKLKGDIGDMRGTAENELENINKL